MLNDMQLAKVIGTLVATQKYVGLEGVKFLIVQPLNKRQEPEGEPVIAADGTAQAGPGMLVFVVASREAALAMPVKFVPVDHAVVGIVDEVDVLPFASQAASNDKCN
jgi:ethanolamine utilization protein EutN